MTRTPSAKATTIGATGFSRRLSAGNRVRSSITLYRVHPSTPPESAFLDHSPQVKASGTPDASNPKRTVLSWHDEDGHAARFRRFDHRQVMLDQVVLEDSRTHPKLEVDTVSNMGAAAQAEDFIDA